MAAAVAARRGTGGAAAMLAVATSSRRGLVASVAAPGRRHLSGGGGVASHRLRAIAGHVTCLASASSRLARLAAPTDARRRGAGAGGAGGFGGRGAGGLVAATAAAAAGVAAGSAGSPVAAEGSSQEGRQPLTWAELAKIPKPGEQTVGAPTFLPDGSHVLYLRSAEYGNLSRQLYATCTKTGKTQPLACTPPGTGEEENLSLEEKLRRERARIMNTGVTSFQVAGAGNGKAPRILVPMGGALYIREGVEADAPMRRLFDPAAAPLGPGPILDPQISEDGSTVCFVWREELYCVPADGSAPPRAITSGARGTGVTHGLADFLAQEELDRYEGFWMSKDGKQVVYESVDESHIPEFRIMHSGSEAVGDGAQEDHRYPFAGKPNPKVKLFVVSTSGGDAAAGGVPKSQAFDLTAPFGEDFYLGRVQWLPDGAIAAQVLNREQTELAVLRLDPKTGKSKQLFSEKTNVWINIHDMLKPIGKTGKLLWASERSGFRHLYTFDPSTGKMSQITSGEWQVEAVSAVDDKNGMVYFMGTSERDWLGRHLFRVPLDGRGKPELITKAPGTHGVVVDKSCKTFVDISSSVDRPGSALLRSLDDGRELSAIFKNEDPKIAAFALSPPEFVTLPSTDGKVTLQAALYKPDPAKFGPGPYPTVVSCYGGPHVQFVGDLWRMTMDMRAQMMRDRGFLVLKVDNRGSNRRGLHFEGALKHDMGNLEVEDQAAGVKWCAARGLADPSRVGIFGASYGGYLSAMCLAKAPDTFKCAVAMAPVTSWDGYDTCYTERYMGTPESNPKGYKTSSIMEYVDGMRGDLLLVHGLIDENVHFRHTARLINSLIAAKKPYQLLLFPNERHSPRSPKDREYLEEQMFNFFAASLKP